MKGSYYVVFCVRDSVDTIEQSVKSWLFQSHQPSQVIAIDDGSMDGTSSILEDLKKEFPRQLNIIQTGNKTRDYTRIPSLWNMALSPAYNNTYHVISAGDIVVPVGYAEKIISIMDADEKIVVVSGTIEGTHTHVPRGAGRFVRESYFWSNYKQGYPSICGYETELIEHAKVLRKKVMVVDDLQFRHTEKLGGKHHFREEGRGMKCLDYHPLYAVGRIVTAATRKEVGLYGALSMFKEYVSFTPEKTGYFRVHDTIICHHIRKEQERKIKSLIMRTSV